MAGVTLIRVNATMSAVCAATGFLLRASEVQSRQERNGEAYRCLLHYDVPDEQVLEFQTLHISIRLCIFQETGDKFDRLLGPTTYNAI
jgi:hypothetical protein